MFPGLFMKRLYQLIFPSCHRRASYQDWVSTLQEISFGEAKMIFCSGFNFPFLNLFEKMFIHYLHFFFCELSFHGHLKNCGEIQ